MKVYFIPGLGANCKCFKFIKLPEGFEKVYIEWFTPKGTETIEEYTHKMAETINTSEPFILVGYSFGGVIVQEMNKFMNPEKTILIASMKDEQQIPPLFKILKKIKFAHWFPMKFFTNKGFLSYTFFRSIYFRVKSPRIQNKEDLKIEEYMSQMNLPYLKWSINQIINWKPQKECGKLYQIHGTKDIIFPYKRIYKRYNGDKNIHLQTIEKASHILVLEYPHKINKAFERILLQS